MEKEKDIVYMAIDPGFKGGVAVINKGVVSVINTPTYKVAKKKVVKKKTKTTNKSMYDKPAMANILRPYQSMNVKILIEKVSTRPGEGAVSAFSFGQGVGIWEGIAAAFGFEVFMITPANWKKHFPEFTEIKPVIHKDLGIEDVKKADKKLKDKANRLIKKRAKELAAEMCLERYPNLEGEFDRSTVDDGKADALLMAIYLMETPETKGN